MFFICFTTKKGRFTTSLFIVKKDMPKESVKRNHVVQILRKRISEFKLKEDNTMRINGFSGTNTQTGTMVFDWKDSSDKTFKTLESLEIGYITDRTNPILLDFDLMTLNPINDVQVKVIEDMNLGVVFAGERLSTKNSQNNGHPAKIEIKGKNKKRVVIKIPKIAKITNEKKDSLDVSLSFRENNSQVLIKEFNKDKGNESNNGMVSLKDILIDGESETSTKNKGTYEGNFIVRVEYEQ